jgi:hypothetical protein
MPGDEVARALQEVTQEDELGVAVAGDRLRRLGGDRAPDLSGAAARLVGQQRLGLDEGVPGLPALGLSTPAFS